MARTILQAPPAPPPQPDQSVVLGKWTGLKNTVTRERLTPEELELAVNVDIDDVGQLHRRRGYHLAVSGYWGGLFTDSDGWIFGIKDGDLVLVRSNFTIQVLQSGFPTPCPPMAWVQVGPTIYFSSRTNSGKIDRDTLTVSAWKGPVLTPPSVSPLVNMVDGIVLPVSPAVPPSMPADSFWYSPVVNPTATLQPIRGKILGPPPLATCLTYFNGRIYLAQGRTVWMTELYLYDYVDRTKGFWSFEADVTMLGAVMDGIYVGTKEGVWFISKEFRMEAQGVAAKRVRVLDFGVIPGSMCYVPGELANPQQVGLEAQTPAEVAILFLTTEGYCGGQDGGKCYNYTESKFIFPTARRAASIFRRQDGVNQYLAVTDSGGTPSSNARMGDYVDAQLLKNGNWDTQQDCIQIGDNVAATIVNG